MTARLDARQVFVRYLEAKRTVDDRALNPEVRARLLEMLARWEGPLEVLEIGAGIGTMIARLESWGALREARYTALDAEAVNIEALLAGLRARGFRDCAPGTVERSGLEVRALTDDFYAFVEEARDGPGFDLILAHAVLDLFDLDTVVPCLLRLTRPGTLLYLTVTFDGETCFEPPTDLDAEIEALYHETMDTRLVNGLPSGDSRCGRHLVDKLRQAGAEVLASGRSDWVVRPPYEADEGAFVGFILDTVADALSGRAALDGWLGTRRRQLEAGVLGFRARHVDVLARIPGAD